MKNSLSFSLGTGLLLVLASITFSPPAPDISVLTDRGTAAYRNADLPIEDRASDLLKRMRPEEKQAQVLSRWRTKAAFQDENGIFDPAKAKKEIPHGIGHIGRPSELVGSGGGGRSPRAMAEYCNAVQKYLLEETRLGIPALFHEEALHGHAAKDATSFSQPIGLASTWNPALIEELYTMTALEASARGASVVLTPVVDVVREPRWGRVEETYGEDPYLSAEMGLAAVRGFQGRGETIGKDRVLATLKHMTGHGQPETGTNIAPANYSRRIIREVFLYPFKRIVTEANVRNIMASYNEIDGVPSHANDWMLNEVLRGEWGFQGAVVSDYYAVRELKDRHAVAESLTQAAALALSSGIDIELPDPEAFPYLLEAIDQGLIEAAVLDTAVARILRQKFELGLFEDPYVDPDRAVAVTGAEEHARLAQRAAEETMILLENRTNLAPLNLDKIKTIAVIGPNADKELLGGYSDVPKYFVTVLEGIREYVGDRANVVYAEGVRVTEPGSWYADPVVRSPDDVEWQRIQEAVATALTADVIILAVGGNELTSREAWAESHMGDRADLQLVGMQDKLIDALAATGKPIVSLLFNGRPLAATNLIEKVPTVFECWYMGQETGRGVARVLFGDVNPGGKLPLSIPRSVGHIPAYYNYKPTARRGFLFDDVSALYSFGYGLSYTTFRFGAPRLSKATIAPDESVTVRVDVTNTGLRAGHEVAQLYIRDKFSSVTRPVKELKGFQKIYLEPGETQTVTLEITPDKLAFYDIDMNWTVEPGAFDILVGNSSRNEDLQSVELVVK